MLPIARCEPPARTIAVREAAAVPERRAERVAAGLLDRYLRAVARRARVAYADENGRALAPADVDAHVDALIARPQPIVATYWIDNALGVALLPFVDTAFARLLSTVTCVIDDTFAGRVAGRLIEGIAGRCALLPLPGDPERLAQVHGLMTRRSSCAFPVDGGGPYRQVGTGIVTLAASLRAAIVPLAAVVRPAVPSLHGSRVRVPLPRARLGVVFGRPVAVGRDDDRRALAVRLRTTLNDLDTLARVVARRA